MIVGLIEETSQNLADWQEYIQNKDLSTDITDTGTCLEDLSKSVLLFQAKYRNVSDTLTTEMVEETTRVCNSLRHEVKESKALFASQRRQVKQLRAIQKTLGDLERQTSAAWLLYVAGVIEPYQDRYQLVKNLPEIKNQRSTIESLISGIESKGKKLPSREEDILQFNRDRYELDKRLVNVSSLPEPINEFLMSVNEGGYTLADLTDEIMEWCRQENRGRVFKISY